MPHSGYRDYKKKKCPRFSACMLRYATLVGENTVFKGRTKLAIDTFHIVSGQCRFRFVDCSSTASCTHSLSQGPASLASIGSQGLSELQIRACATGFDVTKEMPPNLGMQLPAVVRHLHYVSVAKPAEPIQGSVTRRSSLRIDSMSSRVYN